MSHVVGEASEALRDRKVESTDRPSRSRVRLRLRAALWRQWKTPRRRRAALIALGVSGELRNMAGSGRGPWHLARSKALSVGLSNAYFKSLGLPSLIDAR